VEFGFYAIAIFFKKYCNGVAMFLEIYYNTIAMY